MSDKKIITVFGATGDQGGSTVRTILSDSKMKQEWHVRAVSRDTTKPSAQALKGIGAELVTADFGDAASLKKAVAGAYAVFAVTNYWETGSREGEEKQGIAMVDAAKEAGVQHFIWSSLLNVTELSNGRLSNVYHFDSKADVENHIRSIKLPATFILLGFYSSNFYKHHMLSKGPDGKFAINFPIPSSSQAPVIDTIKDTGKFVKGILLNREKTLGKRILAAEKYYTWDEILEDFRQVFPETGKNAQYNELSHEAFKSYLQTAGGLTPVVAQEMLENMRLYHEYGYYGGESLDLSHSILSEKLTTWKETAKNFPAWAGLK